MNNNNNNKPIELQKVVNEYICGDKQKFIINGDWLGSVYLAERTGFNNWEEYFSEPDFKDLEEKEKIYFVAKCHWLTNTHGLLKQTPKWILSEKYSFLKDPYFPGGMKSDMYRFWTMVETPVEFTMRNIFVSNNAMVRV